MKRLILGMILIVGLTVSNAAKFTVVDYSASGGSTITADISAKGTSRIVVWSILAKSDLATSVIDIKKADEKGVTTAYTTVFQYDVGAASLELGNDGVPIFIGSTGYAYQILLDSTTKNSLAITAEKTY